MRPQAQRRIEPGRPVRDEPEYLGCDAAKRRYWERGAADELSPDEHAILARTSEVAARWEATDPSASTDHGVIVRSVVAFVHSRMPRGDVEGRPAPPRSLGWILRSGVCERRVPPPDTAGRAGEPQWVCLNAVALLGAILRKLGYPVRECNVYLAQCGNRAAGYRGAMYQEAAAQVWFEGRWHWVDPYLAIFDPAFTRDDASIYKVDDPHYWDGTVTPSDWRPARSDTAWRPFDSVESLGTDLHRRFHVKRTQPAGDDWGGTTRVSRPASDVDRRGGTATSGIFIRTRAPGVTLELKDEAGRVTSMTRREIPGALHVARCTPVPYVAQGMQPTDPGAVFTIGLAGLEHLETVFFGTRSLLASWEEVGNHALALVVAAPMSQTVDLECDLVAGDHPTSVTDLPTTVAVERGAVTLSFTVTIDPIDWEFHRNFQRGIATGALSSEEYWAAADSFKAIVGRHAGGERRASMTGRSA